MRGLKSYYLDRNVGNEIHREVRGYIPLAKVPGKFVRLMYSYIAKDLKFEKEKFLSLAYREILLVHFNMEATTLDNLLTIEQIEDKGLIFGYPEFSEMVEQIYER